MWNKYDLRQAKVAAPPGTLSVAVACVDGRESLRQGDIVPELIGVTRNGYGIPYRVKSGRVAHECILDLREWKTRARIDNVHGDRHVFCSFPPVAEG
jgi:hypothetical protein